MHTGKAFTLDGQTIKDVVLRDGDLYLETENYHIAIYNSYVINGSVGASRKPINEFLVGQKVVYDETIEN
jgi:hypothetical protein